ncbi:hypothetical protein LCGC14_1774570 [marine sediment metagenome]|uniref:Terminase small subunit n=1 Tax=marine sediment metagenome TaxID=412755 RepID=A0A0F9JWY9_9ZZZZ
MKQLTNKQKQFTMEYIVDFNASQAALRAGYSKNGIAQTAHNLLMNTNIKQEIEQVKQRLTQRTAYTQETGLAKLLHAYNVAERQRQPAAMVSAIIGANRMHGFDKDANIGEKTIIIISPKVPKVIESKEIEKDV